MPVEEIWTEKYRPKSFSEIVGQEDIVERLDAFVKNRSLPHCLFSGPAGTGKTTTALVMARAFFGEGWHSNFLELNASVTPETPVMVRKGNKVKRTNFHELAKDYFKDGKSRYARAKGLEILSIDKKYNSVFSKVSLISRHRVRKIAKIRYEGGRVRTSLNHSVIVIGENGELVPRMVSDLKKGDSLLTFSSVTGGKTTKVSLKEFSSNPIVNLKSGIHRNPKFIKNFDDMELDCDTSWLLGNYLAEGCTSFSGETSGQVIFTFGSHEREIAEKTKDIISDKFGLKSEMFLASSGFDRSRKTSLQVRTCNTQLAKFFANHFYECGVRKNALSKRVPDFIFDTGLENRIAFLQGYKNDGTGNWNEFVRYSSRSGENLIDVSWLGRLSGLDTSCFSDEARAVWKLPTYSYIKSELLDSRPVIRLFESLGSRSCQYHTKKLRHQLYSKKSRRISKSLVMEMLENIEEKMLSSSEKSMLKNIKKLADSCMSSVQIKSIEIEDYNDWVYDVSVPGMEMFWGGTTPILLHNSDERGIDTIRTKVKDFARTRPVGHDFKIIYLDEADALTKDAQHALRRTMEKYASMCRFILGCNYLSKLILPIQSRTAVFKFKPLEKKDVVKFIETVSKGESIKIDDESYDAIFHISEGDLRKAVNILQTAASTGKKITKKVIYSVVSDPNPEEVRKMMELAFSRKFEESRKVLLSLLRNQGLSGEDIIKEIHSQLFQMEIPEEKRARIAALTGECEFRLAEGCNSQVQLESLLAQMMIC